MSRLKFILVALPLLALMCSGGCSRSERKPAADPPAAAPTARPEVVGNATCPVSDKPVGGSASAPSFYSDFQGKRVGFMCPSCKAKFDSAPDNKKQELLNKALKSKGRAPVK